MGVQCGTNPYDPVAKAICVPEKKRVEFHVKADTEAIYFVTYDGLVEKKDRCDGWLFTCEPPALNKTRTLELWEPREGKKVLVARLSIRGVSGDEREIRKNATKALQKEALLANANEI